MDSVTTMAAAGGISAYLEIAPRFNSTSKLIGMNRGSRQL
jgi:hypothetical protein